MKIFFSIIIMSSSICDSFCLLPFKSYHLKKEKIRKPIKYSQNIDSLKPTDFMKFSKTTGTIYSKDSIFKWIDSYEKSEKEIFYTCFIDGIEINNICINPEVLGVIFFNINIQQI